MNVQLRSFSEFRSEINGSFRSLDELSRYVTSRVSGEDEEPARPHYAAALLDGVLDTRWAGCLGEELRTELGLSAEATAEAACEALERYAAHTVTVRRVPCVAAGFLVRIDRGRSLALVSAAQPPARQWACAVGLIGEALFVPPPPEIPDGMQWAREERYRTALASYRRRSSAFGRAFAVAFLKIPGGTCRDLLMLP